MNGLEATQVIRAQFPQTRILVLTQHEDRRFVTSLLQAGASGYVHKRALETDLINALRAVAQGQAFVDPTIATLIVDAVRHPDKTEPVPVNTLTSRERQVLGLIALGKTNAQIATALGLSVHTVIWHRVNLMSKLDLHNVADLVRYALENGLAAADE
jgi:two-component system, NarL family, response regulator NreC